MKSFESFNSNSPEKKDVSQQERTSREEGPVFDESKIDRVKLKSAIEMALEKTDPDYEEPKKPHPREVYREVSTEDLWEEIRTIEGSNEYSDREKQDKIVELDALIKERGNFDDPDPRIRYEGFVVSDLWEEIRRIEKSEEYSDKEKERRITEIDDLIREYGKEAENKTEEASKAENLDESFSEGREEENDENPREAPPAADTVSEPEKEAVSHESNEYFNTIKNQLKREYVRNNLYPHTNREKTNSYALRRLGKSIDDYTHIPFFSELPESVKSDIIWEDLVAHHGSEKGTVFPDEIVAGATPAEYIGKRVKEKYDEMLQKEASLPDDALEEIEQKTREMLLRAEEKEETPSSEEPELPAQQEGSFEYGESLEMLNLSKLSVGDVITLKTIDNKSFLLEIKKFGSDNIYFDIKESTEASLRENIGFFKKNGNIDMKDEALSFSVEGATGDVLHTFRGVEELFVEKGE